MTTSPRAISRSDQRAPATDTRLTGGSIDQDDIDAVFNSLSYLLGERASSTPATTPVEPTAELDESDIVMVDDSWLDPVQLAVTARVAVNQHTMATLRPERLEVPVEARVSLRSLALTVSSAPSIPMGAPSSADTPPDVDTVSTRPELAPDPARPDAPRPELPSARPPALPAVVPPAEPVVMSTDLPPVPQAVRQQSSRAAPAPSRSLLTELMLPVAMVVCAGLGAYAHRWYAWRTEAEPATVEAPAVAESRAGAAAAPAPAEIATEAAAEAATAAPAPPSAPAIATSGAVPPVRFPARASAKLSMSPAALAAALKRMSPAPTAQETPSTVVERQPRPAPVVAPARPTVIPSTGPVLLDDH